MNTKHTKRTKKQHQNKMGFRVSLRELRVLGDLRVSSRRLVLLAGAVVLASACTTTRAATPIERPALEVPPPPPRVITPLPPPESPSIDPVGDLQPNANPPSRPRPQRDRANDTSKPAEAKPETPPPTDPPPAQPPAPAPQSPVLRIPETQNSAQAASQIKEVIDRAKGILSRTHYEPLSDARKKAYRDAQLFAQQAEDALKASNLVFAKELAEKAERLAKELQGR